MTELVWERARGLPRAWIAGWWAASRLLVFVSAAIVGAVGPRGYTHQAAIAHPFGLLGAWDGRWYRTVAENGYLLEPGRQSDPAFFGSAAATNRSYGSAKNGVRDGARCLDSRRCASSESRP